jgi:hypothetical protein
MICAWKTVHADGINQLLCAILIAAILIIQVVSHVRRQKMIEKLLDVLTAVAIGTGLAVLLVAWWSS